MRARRARGSTPCPRTSAPSRSGVEALFRSIPAVSSVFPPRVEAATTRSERSKLAPIGACRIRDDQAPNQPKRPRSRGSPLGNLPSCLDGEPRSATIEDVGVTHLTPRYQKQLNQPHHASRIRLASTRPVFTHEAGLRRNSMQAEGHAYPD